MGFHDEECGIIGTSYRVTGVGREIKWLKVVTTLNKRAATSENVPLDVSAQRKFRSDCANAQADLNLRWALKVGAFWTAKDARFSDTISKVSDQTAIIKW